MLYNTCYTCKTKTCIIQISRRGFYLKRYNGSSRILFFSFISYFRGTARVCVFTTSHWHRTHVFQTINVSNVPTSMFSYVVLLITEFAFLVSRIHEQFCCKQCLHGSFCWLDLIGLWLQSPKINAVKQKQTFCLST